jgi:hypothetical protein
MPSIVAIADIPKLRRSHIQRAWFGEFDFPDGIKYLHTGMGRVTVGGHEYLGVSDPLSGRLVSIDQVEEPRFGQASAVTIGLSGVSRDFIADVFSDARDIEGRSAVISWAMFDPETQQILFNDLVPLFPRGRMSAPSISWQGIGIRSVTLTVENIWASQNFAPGGKWNPADQRKRFAGDKGLDFVGVNVTENWT